MGASILTLGIPVVAFLLVLGFQRKNWSQARDVSEKIREILKNDINGLSSSADWVMVIDHFDRLLEVPLDAIRRLANAALVTGIGGTMGIFLIKVILIPQYNFEPPEIPLEMMVGIGIALLSSLIGVVLHLHIVSELGKAQDSVSDKEKELFSSFIISEGPSIDARDLQDIKGTMQKVKTSQDEFLRKTQTLFNDQSQIAKEMAENVDQLTKELKGLPEGIVRAIDMSDKFEKQVRAHIQNLYDIFEKHKDFLTQKIVSNQDEMKRLSVAHLETALKEVVEIVQRPIEGKIVVPLEKVSKQLNRTSEEMDKAITGLEPLLKKMPDAASKFCREIERTSNTFNNASQDLMTTVTEIHETVDKATSKTLQPISDDMKEFMGTVRETHGKLEAVVRGLVKLIEDLLHGIKVTK